MPTPRRCNSTFSAPVVNDEIWVIGGATDKNNASDKVEIFNPMANTWRDGPSLPMPTSDHVAVALDNQIYVIGGIWKENGNNNVVAKVYRLNAN